MFLTSVLCLQSGDLGNPGSIGQVGLVVNQYDDGSYIEIMDDWALVEIDELNVPFTNANFDIEVFLVEDVDAQGNIVPKELKDLVDTREMLHPLSFIKQASMIDENDILLDEPTGGNTNLFPELDPSYVEYWFNIWVDHEIDELVLCADPPIDRPRGVFTQDALKCATTDQEHVVPVNTNVVGGTDLARAAGGAAADGAAAAGAGNDLYNTTVADIAPDGDEGDDC